ncbi:MAG: hypothetical protein E6Y55_18615, partial [Klebsiella michiganensis]|nr:hypothetical protein [Klebsiella michiganensis]
SSGRSLPAGTLSKLMSVSFKMYGKQVPGIIANSHRMSSLLFLQNGWGESEFFPAIQPENP